MSKQVILSMLAQGNTGDEILSILDVIVSDIEQEGIDSCAEVFANWFTLTVHTLTNTLLLHYVQDCNAFSAGTR